MKRRAYKVYDTYKRLLIIGLIGIPIGAVVGLIDTVFGRILLRITDFRNNSLSPYSLYYIRHLADASIRRKCRKGGGSGTNRSRRLPLDGQQAADQGQI